jgi:hypothetical protein
MKPKYAKRPPMLVMRGLVNDKLETRERMAVEAIIGGWGAELHYQTLADMQGVMLLAGSTSDSRKWAKDYAHNELGPVLCKIRDRYQRTGKLSCTTGERAVLRGFVTRYREFWQRQPMELYEAACTALQAHYDKMSEVAA